jgi:hypothetical protein
MSHLLLPVTSMTLITLLLLAAAPGCPAVTPALRAWRSSAGSPAPGPATTAARSTRRSGCPRALMLAMHRDTAGGRPPGSSSSGSSRTDAWSTARDARGRPPPTSDRVAQGPACIVFENPEHTFPRRILYWRDGATLHARIEGTRQGKPAAKDWAWTAPPNSSK